MIRRSFLEERESIAARELNSRERGEKRTSDTIEGFSTTLAYVTFWLAQRMLLVYTSVTSCIRTKYRLQERHEFCAKAQEKRTLRHNLGTV